MGEKGFWEGGAELVVGSDEGLRGLSRGGGGGGVEQVVWCVEMGWCPWIRRLSVELESKRRLKLREEVDLGALEPLWMEVRTLLTLLAGSVICFRTRLHGARGANGGENEWFPDADLEDSQATVEFTIAKLRHGRDGLSKLRPSPLSVDPSVVGWWGGWGREEGPLGGVAGWLGGWRRGS